MGTKLKWRLVRSSGRMALLSTLGLLELLEAAVDPPGLLWSAVGVRTVRKTRKSKSNSSSGIIKFRLYVIWVIVCESSWSNHFCRIECLLGLLLWISFFVFVIWVVVYLRQISLLIKRSLLQFHPWFVFSNWWMPFLHPLFHNWNHEFSGKWFHSWKRISCVALRVFLWCMSVSHMTGWNGTATIFPGQKYVSHHACRSLAYSSGAVEKKRERVRKGNLVTVADWMLLIWGPHGIDKCAKLDQLSCRNWPFLRRLVKWCCRQPILMSRPKRTWPT